MQRGSLDRDRHAKSAARRQKRQGDRAVNWGRLTNRERGTSAWERSHRATRDMGAFIRRSIGDCCGRLSDLWVVAHLPECPRGVWVWRPL
jgi:hypothetical protein